MSRSTKPAHAVDITDRRQWPGVPSVAEYKASWTSARCDCSAEPACLAHLVGAVLPDQTIDSSYYTKGNFLAHLTDAAIDVFAEYAATKPSTLSEVLEQTIRGAAARVPSEAMAFAHRRLPYAPVIVSQWLEAADAEKNVAWARDFGKALQTFAGGGVHVNDLSHDDADRVRTAYGANYERLAALKKKYDPDNLFHLNPNIKPSP